MAKRSIEWTDAIPSLEGKSTAVGLVIVSPEFGAIRACHPVRPSGPMESPRPAAIPPKSPTMGSGDPASTASGQS